ncbi:MAG: translation initiation factor IF-2 [Ruminococcaceae bacterium]|nr:translation initiation factor IF-2 [Oscillospiraceae bacterium]
MAFKITQLAKDLGIKSKDITELMTARGMECKTTQKTLTPTEFNVIFEVLTRGKQVKNIDDYLFGDTYIPTKAPAKKEQAAVAPVEAVAAEKKEEGKAVAETAPVKETAPKMPEVKAEPEKKAPKAENKKASAEAVPAKHKEEKIAEPEVKSAPKTETAQKTASTETASVPVVEKVAPAAVPPAKPNPRTYNIPQNLRATMNQRPAAPAGNSQRTAEKTAGDSRFAPRPGTNAPAQGGKSADNRFHNDRFANPGFGASKPGFGGRDQQPRPTQNDRNRGANGGFKDKDEGGRAPREHFQVQAIVRGQTPKGTDNSQKARGTRVVDMRGSSVDLSKYDERLDTFVPDAVRDARGGNQRFKKQQVGTHAMTAGKKGSKKSSAPVTKQANSVVLPEEITVSEFASRMKIAPAQVVKQLMMMGMMVTLNQTIDFDTAFLIATELGVEATKEVVVSIEEKLFDETEDAEENLVERAPVVCVMGHVDHGKTSLLDAIRHTHVTAGEAGGITQHIGAYRVKAGGRDITFLDTPGHEAFTSMRARGAQSTDIAILVVAADDGIMPQTVEAINHAKAAGIDIIVAINKMDKPTANPDAVKQALTNYSLVPEEWGGDVICVPVSALTGMGIDDLLENVILVADMKELKANPDRRAKGIVIESRLDKGCGPVATVLVQNGTLHTGDIIIAGTAVGRVRSMKDHTGRTVKVAGPSVPVEIIGLAEVPEAGDDFAAVEDERMARTLADQRRDKAKEEGFKANARANLNDLFAQISDGVKELNIIVKADVVGSAEAVKQSLEKISNEEVKVRVIHAAAGGIIEGDVMLAAASNAIIVGFNVRPDKAAIDSADRQGVDIRTYRVIYECIEEVTAAMKGMLAPKFTEVLMGHAEVRQTIHVPNVGFIAGSYVQDGKITRASQIRVVRDGVVIFEDKIGSLRRFKDDVKEVAEGYECGIALDRFNDIKVGDILEAFVMEEIKQ